MCHDRVGTLMVLYVGFRCRMTQPLSWPTSRPRPKKTPTVIVVLKRVEVAFRSVQLARQLHILG